MSDTDAGYKVLARKYRPETFADLVGQDAMVRTLKNAFAADRIAQAFIVAPAKPPPHGSSPKALTVSGWTETVGRRPNLVANANIASPSPRAVMSM